MISSENISVVEHKKQALLKIISRTQTLSGEVSVAGSLAPLVRYSAREDFVKIKQIAVIEV